VLQTASRNMSCCRWQCKLVQAGLLASTGLQKGVDLVTHQLCFIHCNVQAQEAFQVAARAQECVGKPGAAQTGAEAVAACVACVAQCQGAAACAK
jgi:hypothetical protein